MIFFDILRKTWEGEIMVELNPKYTLDDYARAILRSAISTENRKFKSILLNYFDDSTLVRNNIGNISITRAKYGTTTNAYQSAVKQLNDAFFYSTENTENARLIAQTYGMFGVPGKLETLLKMESYSSDKYLNIDPLLKLIMSDFYEDSRSNLLKIIDDFDNGKITEEEQQELLNANKKKKIVGAEYHNKFIRNGYSESMAREMESFLDIANYKSNGKIMEFLNTYTMYHYYLFRKNINNRFKDFAKQHEGLSDGQHKVAFEEIINRQIALHCKSGACKNSAFFKRKHMHLNPHRMTLEKSHKIIIELSDEHPCHLQTVMDYISDTIRATDGKDRIIIDDIIICPPASNSPSSDIHVNVRSGVQSLVSNNDPSTQNQKPEYLVPNIPQYKSKIVYDSSKYKQPLSTSQKHPTPKPNDNSPQGTQLSIDDYLR